MNTIWTAFADEEIAVIGERGGRGRGRGREKEGERERGNSDDQLRRRVSGGGGDRFDVSIRSASEAQRKKSRQVWRVELDQWEEKGVQRYPARIRRRDARTRQGLEDRANKTGFGAGGLVKIVIPSDAQEGRCALRWRAVVYICKPESKRTRLWVFSM